MRAALVQSFDHPPVYGSIADPTPAPDETLISVRASALTHLVQGQAAGSHYSSRAVFPFVPGVDGVGKLADGTRVYFGFPRSPYGAMAELVAVSSDLYTPLPDDLDDATAAALANPGMSSWAALTRRAHFVAGETVLINGATGVAGRLSIQIAKYLGAGRIIVTGRNQKSLEELPGLGADAAIPLDQTPEELRRAFQSELAQGVDVVLDYLWGDSALQLISAISGSGSPAGEPRIRFVQIGAISGGSIALPGSALRSSGLELMGSGLGSVSLKELVASIGELMQAAVPAGMKVETETAPLADVEAAWNKETGGKRLVFTV